MKFFYFTITTLICNTDNDVSPFEHIRWDKQKKQTKNERMLKMKRSFSKRAWSAFLALAIIVTAVFGNVTTAKAETTDYTTPVWEYGTATAGVETVKYPFTVDKDCAVDIGLLVPAVGNVTINVYKAGTLYDSLDISAYDSYWEYFASDAAFNNGWYFESLSAGDYSVSYVFGADTDYIAYVFEYVAQAKISQTSATITKGFTKKLSVENGKVKKWSSSKTSVAKVDSKGKVTAKKAGKTTITATLEDGSKLKCTVTVKENKYSDSKLTTSDVYRGDCAMSAYSASFDKSGNLVIKTRFVNNNYYKVSKLENIKVVVKDGNGKTVGTYKLSKKSVSIPSGSTKDFSFTIKKSSLKKKTADLRNCTITCEGTYVYYY